MLKVPKFTRDFALSMGTTHCHDEAYTSGSKCLKMVSKSVMDAERSGRPSTSTTDEKLKEARAIILTDIRVTIEEIALQLGISKGTAYSLVHDILVFHKVAAR